MSVPPPPEPFEPDAETLAAGTLLYRVGSIERTLTAFNPGLGDPTRFGFFGSPPVPLLYAAQTERAALAETVLHDVPISGGYLAWERYSAVVMGRLILVRGVRLARLRGLGLRRLGVSAQQITDTDAGEYARTVAWSAAAHRAGFDGLSWTSRLCNDAYAVVLFGDRAEHPVDQDPTFGRHFTSGPGLDWLIDTCVPLRVEVLPPH